MNYQTFQINDQFAVTTVPATRKMELSDDVNAAIDSIWKNEFLRSQGRLFNGKLLSMISWDKDQLVGEFVDYKYYLAQTKDPKLEPLLRIRPIAMSGITYSGNKILFGLRAETLSQNPLFYELAPSGGVDPSVAEGNSINIHKLVLKELQEEAGLIDTDILSVRLFTLVYEPDEQSFEICTEIHVNPSIANSKILPVDEYIRFFWVEPQDVAHFVSRHREKLLPMSLHLLKLKGISA